MQPAPKFFIVCGDLVDAMPGKLYLTDYNLTFFSNRIILIKVKNVKILILKTFMKM